MFQVRNTVSVQLSSSLSNATTNLSFSSPDGSAFPTTTQLNNGNNQVCVAVLEDGGVTQANPEYVLLQGSFSATLVQAKKRGFLGTTVPTSWPSGTNVHLYNIAEFFNMMGANTLAYTVQCEGHINTATPTEPGSNGMRWHANGSALPSNVDNITISVNPGGFDLSNYFGLFASGDYLRMRWIYFDLDVSAATTSGASLGQQEHRAEIKLNGAPVDNTSYWTFPVNPSTLTIHGDIPNDSAGIQGMLIFDLVKAV